MTGAGALKTNDEPHGRWLQLLPSLPALTAVLGLLVYATLRFAHSRFYTPLGVRPEDVGTGYAQILAYAGPALFALLLAGLYLAGGALIFGVFLRTRTGRRTVAEVLEGVPPGTEESALHAEVERIERLRARVGVASWIITLVYTAIALLGAVVWLGNKATEGKDDALAGRRVEPVQILGMQVLSLSAVPSTITPLDSSSAAPLDIYSNVCLLYLGHGDGISLFLEPKEDFVLRVPDGVMTFEAMNTDNCQTP